MAYSTLSLTFSSRINSVSAHFCHVHFHHMTFVTYGIFTNVILTTRHFYHLAFLPMAFYHQTFLPSCIFTIWHLSHQAFLPITFSPLPLTFFPSMNSVSAHFNNCNFYHLTFLQMNFLPSDIFTNGFFYHQIFLPSSIFIMFLICHFYQ